jgi:hypothetical protein
VIEWTTVPVPYYMSGDAADTILNRLITRLLPAPVTIPETTVTLETIPIVTTTLPATTATTVNSIPTSAPPATAGDVTVYSSPPGASILIDGVYYGTTPANLTGIQQGNHIIRLTQSGYYDYEGTIYVIPGQTAHAFGTLPPLNQYSTATPVPTAIVPIIVPVVTAEPTQAKGLLENSSVVVAIIGVITALIAGGAAVFPHVFKPPKKD